MYNKKDKNKFHRKGIIIMLLKYILLIIIGLSSGACVAAGLFAFIVALGVINRLVTRTKTYNHIRLYETAVISGAIILNMVYLFSSNLPTGYIGLLIFGTFSGMFIGIQAIALTETIKTLPILMLRLNLNHGLPYILLTLAIGKTVGSLFGFLYKL
jgi:stage V sporulation protein AB